MKWTNHLEFFNFNKYTKNSWLLFYLFIDFITWLIRLALIQIAHLITGTYQIIMTINCVYVFILLLFLYSWLVFYRAIVGITEDTQRGHIIRATLEAVCYQTRDILDAMNKDCGIPLTKLQVDGGMTANNLLMQLQADLSGVPIGRRLALTH